MNLIVSSRSVPVLRTLWRTALPAVASLVAISAEAQIQVDHAVVEFDELVRSYNAIVLGDATFNNGQHSHAGVAVGGNLTSNGWIYAQQVDSGADPTLYVTGTTTLNGESKLERGYATLNPGQTGTWNSPNPRDLTSGGGKLTVQNNTNIAQATLDPRTNPAPAGWNWATLETQFIKISETLAAAAQTTGASIHLDGQTLVFDAGTNTSGSVVFNLTATLLTGLGYYSGVVVNVPADTVFIINVSGFDGGSLFAGKNFNGGTNDNQVIWNLIDGDGNPANNTLTLGNNDNFYGSILAPEFTLNNGNAQVDGQIVAGGLTYGSRELHYTGFDTPQFYDDLPEVPEPSTYGMMGAAGLVGLLVWRRRQQRRLVA